MTQTHFPFFEVQEEVVFENKGNRHVVPGKEYLLMFFPTEKYPFLALVALKNHLLSLITVMFELSHWLQPPYL
jgi:hypothetical protein